MGKWDEGRVCDVCHQVHHQISPACIERRRQREYEESEEGQRAIKEMIVNSVVASQALAGITVSHEDAGRWYDDFTNEEIERVIANAEASGDVVWPEQDGESR